MADEKAEGSKPTPTASVLPSEPSKLKKFKSTMTEPSKVRQWYLDYILSDFMFTSVYVAVLLTVKVYFNIEWTRFFDGLTLFYVVFAGTLVAKACRTVCNYYDKKAKLMELIAKTNDLRNVRL